MQRSQAVLLVLVTSTVCFLMCSFGPGSQSSTAVAARVQQTPVAAPTSGPPVAVPAVLAVSAAAALVPVATELAPADASQWRKFAEPLPAENPWPRDPASQAVLRSPACMYDPEQPRESMAKIMSQCFPKINIDHVMRDGQGNGCGIPSQIGGRCYCPTEVDADECKFVKSGLSMDLACRMLFLSTAITTGPVVEFGTWSGHSTRCMSAGAGVRGIANRVHGCDFFEAGHDYVKLRWTKYWSSALNQKSSLLPIFRDLTTPFYPSITYHQGDCHKIPPGSWSGKGQLSMFTTDASKSDGAFLADFERVWQSISVGTILFVYGNLVAGGFVEPFFVAGRVSHVAFVVLKPFTPTIVSSFNPSSISRADWMKHYDRYLADYNRIAETMQLPEAGREFQRGVIAIQREIRLKKSPV